MTVRQCEWCGHSARPRCEHRAVQCCESMPWRPIQSIAYHYCSGRLGPWYHIGPWATRPLETSCQAQSICATLPTRMLSVPPQLQPAGYRMRVGFADVATPATAAPSRGSHRLLPQLTSQFRSQLIGQTGTKDCRSRCDFWLLPRRYRLQRQRDRCAHSLRVCASVHTLCVCLCAHSVCASVHTLRVPLCTLCVRLCVWSWSSAAVPLVCPAVRCRRFYAVTIR